MENWYELNPGQASFIPFFPWPADPGCPEDGTMTKVEERSQGRKKRPSSEPPASKKSRVQFAEDVSEKKDQKGNLSIRHGATVEPSLHDKIMGRKESKEMRRQRRMQRPGAEILEVVKKTWEECRRTDVPAEDRQSLTEELFAGLKGHFVESLVKNDGSRIVQTLIKYGTLEQRVAVVDELKGHFLELSRNPYGKHIIDKLLQSCPSSRSMIVSEFSGSLGKCLRHRHASSVIDTIYSDHCKVAMRNDLMHEFYGKEFVLFKDYAGVDLEGILSRHPEKKATIIARIRTAIDSVLSKETTALVNHSIVHRLILDYCSHEDHGKLRQWIPTIADTLAEIVHTQDGARAAVLLVACAGAKERKAMIKACKPYMQKMIKDEYAHQVVMAFLSFVDDTVLLEKTFVAEILGIIQDALSSKYSKAIILSCFTGVSTRHFPRDTVNVFQHAMIIARETSKKDVMVRRAEVCAMLAPPLTAHVGGDRLGEMVRGQSTAPLILEMVLSGHAPALLELILELFRKSRLDLLESEPCRVFLKRYLKRCAVEILEQTLSILEPFEDLFASDAAFVLASALDRSEAVRSRVALSITRLPRMTPSAKAMAELVNRLAAGVPLH